jgi:uncharacterized protein YjdB
MTKKIGLAFLCSILFALIFINITESSAKASTVPLPTSYYFVFNGQQKQSGTEYEMKSSEILLNVTSGTWEPSTTVEWITSNNKVVALETTSYGSNFTKLVRKGPGYSTITAVIKQGTNSYNISCVVKVDLEFDHAGTGTVPATTTNERILVINTIDMTKQIYLKYLNNTPDGGGATETGPVISASLVNWESDNEGVATVSDQGLVKAIGSGTAVITATTKTVSSQDKALKISMKVIVAPKFTLEYDDTNGSHHKVDSVPDKDMMAVADKVPSNFVLQSTAMLGTNLKWEVYDFSTKQKLPAGTSSKMTYTVSTISGNVTFSNVKAGTYEVYAFANQSFNTGTNAPYAYMKIVVPINIGEKNIVMTVGDTYSILENSNIPSVGILEYYYEVGNLNIARIDTTTGIITARKNGNVRLRLEYKTSQNLYDGSTVIGNMYINITVIDGISLSATTANIYTKGTLLLTAMVTDPTQPIVWGSSDTTIATVADGLVTGVKAGTVVITAKQTINGVVKKATCEITVQQSVSNIVVDPARVTLGIGDYKTMKATITPANLSGVTLRWKSSNEAVVKIVESSALTTTIQGVAGGNAVISAINQDNVVVGYCHVTVQQPVTSIVLSESDITVNLNTKQLQLRATVYPENAANKQVIWSSTDASKAKVDQNGLVTFLKPGTVSIIATSDDNGKVKAICNINIQIPVISITLDETSKTMYVGQSHRLSYMLLPANSSNNAVTWTSTNTSVVTVDNTGKVTAKGVGTSVIILKSVDGGYSVYCTITVKRVATSIKFDVTELKLKTNEYYYIKPTLTPKDSTENNLVWESSDTKVAIVDENGKVTGKSAGFAIISAKTEAGGIAFCKVTVTQPANSLILNFKEKTIYVKEKFKLKASVSPSTATQLGVTYKSSNTKIATVSDEGEVTGKTGGVVVITVTTNDGGYTETCVVTVKESVSTIKINYSTYKLGLKKSVTLVATVTTPTATNQKVKWSSSNKKVATVNSKGKVTGISKGYATITATALDGSDVEATCEIRVVTPVSSVSLDKTYLSMVVGQNKTLKATIKPSSATYKTAKWKSSDNTVAMVDEDGVVTALKAGTATITADAKDNSGKKAISYVVVRDRVPSTSVTVADKKLVMVSGEQKTVEVVLNPSTSTDSYTWSTDNTAIASVDKKTGKITARSTGTANITVMTESGRTTVIEVNVIGLNITSLVIEEYTTYEYPLTVEGATGGIRWSIDNPKIAVVSNGRISTRGIGTATITAQVNGRKLTCKLKVTKMK